jgi:hypothetical protein
MTIPCAVSKAAASPGRALAGTCMPDILPGGRVSRLRRDQPSRWRIAALVVQKATGLRYPAARRFRCRLSVDDAGDRRAASRAVAASAIGLPATGLTELRAGQTVTCPRVKPVSSGGR